MLFSNNILINPGFPWFQNVSSILSGCHLILALRNIKTIFHLVSVLRLVLSSSYVLAFNLIPSIDVTVIRNSFVEHYWGVKVKENHLISFPRSV